MKKHAGPIGRIHSDHQKFAMGEVDDVHHPEDDGQTKGHKGEKKAHQDPLKNGINDDHENVLKKTVQNSAVSPEFFRTDY